jgi:hypothetical protein
MRTAHHFATFVAILGVAAAVWGSGCGSSGRDSLFQTGTASTSSGGRSSTSGAGSGGTATPGGPSGGGIIIGGGGGATSADASGPQCTSQGQCINHGCANNGHTTITGTVFDPAGINPLYDVVVYVPQTTPSALPSGASCYTCQSLYTGGVVASALTNPLGQFQIVDAPTGKNVPLVVQIGKWRKQYQIDVNDCADNQQQALKLPSNASEGDLPQIAVSTGGSDTLECLLMRIGVDAGGGDAGGTGEYTNGAGGTGAVHIFQGGTNARGGGGGGAGGRPTPGAAMAGGSPASATALWATAADLQPYDIVILSCEGGETANPVPQALNDYAAAGGRVFASHFHYAWFNNKVPFNGYNLATWTAGTQDTGTINAIVQQTLSDGVTPFPKGIAMEQWLANVNALTSTTDGGTPELPILQSKHNADVTAANTPSTPWIVADQAAPKPGATEYFSWDMPVPTPAAGACGRIVFSDLHVGGASGDYGEPAGGGGGLPANAVVPGGCANNTLSPQEKALEFMLFDLSACLTPVNEQPTVPQ